jgi:hypothetical protein
MKHGFTLGPMKNLISRSKQGTEGYAGSTSYLDTMWFEIDSRPKQTSFGMFAFTGVQEDLGAMVVSSWYGATVLQACSDHILTID